MYAIRSYYATEKIIYTGDIRQLHRLVRGIGSGLSAGLEDLKDLRSNGTSNLLCETDDAPWSWVYLPGEETPAHKPSILSIKLNAFVMPRITSYNVCYTKLLRLSCLFLKYLKRRFT